MSGLRRHTVVVSDVHLSQAHPREEDDPLWMRYRWSDYHPDADFEAFIERLLDACGDDSLEMVFNGDVFDFDAPMVTNGTSSFDEYPLDDAGCRGQLERIARDHPRFMRAAARVLVEGHRVMFLSGNHDLELYWPGVRSAIREALRSAATALSPSSDLSDLEERVRFRTWFHVTEDKIYLEHGSQYDMLNGVPDPMRPVIEDASSLHPVCGKLAFKRTGSRMGYFNPYYEETFYMGATGYAKHFFANYMFSSRRHIVRTWVTGALRTVREIVRHRRPHPPDLAEESVELAIRETNASREAILATHALRTPSGERTMIPILRELWLDRIGLGIFVITAVALTLWLGGTTVGAVVAAVLLAAFVVYEIVTPKPDIRTYDMAPPTVRQIFDIHGVRAMCMGHTHRPVGSWENGRFWGNSGAWCPAFVDVECTKPVLDGRPFLWLTAHAEEGTLHGGLHWFRKGALVADPDGTRAVPSSRETVDAS